MEKTIGFPELYALQDRVLAIVSSLENDFFLTGGTALHRYYYNMRYSNDLDFFVQDDNLFSENINQILARLSDGELAYSRVVRTRDFQRILVDDSLQLDFVNDRVYRDGKSVIKQGMRVDNLIKIFTNKLAAVMDRDEEKDIFDIFCVAVHEPFNWGEILAIVSKKAMFHGEDLLERIKLFPLEWLERIKFIRQFTITPAMVETLCRDIRNLDDNTLAGMQS